jgi:hypothetical protein
MERHESSEESQKPSPETPFSSCNEEMEVFLKAKFMAKHKGEGRKGKKTKNSIFGTEVRCFINCFARLTISYTLC